jgi:hypothetical protein
MRDLHRNIATRNRTVSPSVLLSIVILMVGLLLGVSVYSAEPMVPDSTVGDCRLTRLVTAPQVRSASMSPSGTIFCYTPVFELPPEQRTMYRMSTSVLLTDSVDSPGNIDTLINGFGGRVLWLGDSDKLVYVGEYDSLYAYHFFDSDSGYSHHCPIDRAARYWDARGSRLERDSLTYRIISVSPEHDEDTISFTVEDSLKYIHEVEQSPSASILLVKLRWASNGPCRTYLLPIRENTQPIFIDSTWYDVHWSYTDSALYALTSGNDLSRAHSFLKIHLDSKTLQITGEPEVLLTDQRTDERFSVSRDGRRMLYRTAVRGTKLWLYERGAEGDTIWNRRLLREEPIRVKSPRFSPDGKSIAYVRELNSGWSPNEIRTVSVADGTVRLIARSSSNSPSVSWSSDGRFLLYGSGGDYCEPAHVMIANLETGDTVSMPDTRMSFFHAEATMGAEGELIYSRPGGGNYVVSGLNDTIGTLLFERDSSFIPGDELHSLRLPPDGSRFAVAGEARSFVLRRGGDGVWVFDRGNPAPICVIKGPYLPVGWSADEATLYIYSGIRESAVYAVKPPDTSLVTYAHLSDSALVEWYYMLDPAPVDMNKSGTMVVTAEEVRRNDVWLVEGFDPGAEARAKE